MNRSLSVRSQSDGSRGRASQGKLHCQRPGLWCGPNRRDLLAEVVECGLHRIERLMRLQALQARPRRGAAAKRRGRSPDAKSCHPSIYSSRQRRLVNRLLHLYLDRRGLALCVGGHRSALAPGSLASPWITDGTSAGTSRFREWTEPYELYSVWQRGGV